MHTHDSPHFHSDYSDNVYLVGNPNVGKSVLFSALSEKYATVSNYPGTTVEVTRGYIPKKRWLGEGKLCLVDTPGVNSLIPLSEDERVTRDILYEHEKITGEKPRVILVIDAKNLRRGLILGVQLTFAKIPYIVVLNMMDEATSSGVSIDIKKLCKMLTVPVIPAIAIQREGIPEILNLLRNPMSPSINPLLISSKIGNYINTLLQEIPPLAALSVITADTSIRAFLTESTIQKVEKLLVENDVNMHSLQLVWRENADKILSEVYTRDIPASTGFLNKFSRLTIHPVGGFTVLAFVTYVLYKFVGVLGAGLGVDFLEKKIFNGYITPAIKNIFDIFPVSELIKEMFVGPFGILSMGLTYAIAIIFPIVLTYFFAFSFLEDSGYLPRMGALLNNFFKFMGLNGKAILPMVLGLGCDTMATMTARVMNSRKERILVTLLLALGVPCSAQLGVIMAFATYIPFFYMFLWMAIVVVVLLLVGYISSKLIPGRVSLFLLEIPPLRVPKLQNLIMKTYIRTKWYLKEAAPIFLVGTFLLFVLDKLHIISFLNEALKPITVIGLGLPPESARSFIMGFLRRDFGTAGFLMMHEQGLLSPRQVLVSLVVITLFIPCVANFLMMIKEQGIKIATSMFLFIVPFAFLVGTALNYSLKIFGI
ncbi:MAG: ferrous iron transport protein B [Spirochaetia bacterium]|nr:ferrous iron transport protein B [Spirochaetia bacterium]